MAVARAAMSMMAGAVSGSSTDSDDDGEVVDMAIKPARKSRERRRGGGIGSSRTLAADPEKAAADLNAREVALARIYNWKPSSSQALCARFSSDDRFIANALTDGQVQLLSVDDAFPLHEQTAEEAVFKVSKYGMPVMCLRFNPGLMEGASDLLLLATADSGLQQWNIRTKQQVWQGEVSEDEVNGLCYQQAGTTFAAAGKDRIVRIYDEHTKQVTSKLVAHENRIRALSYSPHSQATLVSGGFDGVNIWDVRSPSTPGKLSGVVRITGECIDVYDWQLLTAALPVPGRDGSGALGRLLLWDLRTRRPYQEVEWVDEEGELATSLNACQFSKDASCSHIVAAGGTHMQVFARSDLCQVASYTLPVVKDDKGEVVTPAINNFDLANAGGKAVLALSEGVTSVVAGPTHHKVARPDVERVGVEAPRPKTPPPPKEETEEDVRMRLKVEAAERAKKARESAAQIRLGLA